MINGLELKKELDSEFKEKVRLNDCKKLVSVVLKVDKDIEELKKYNFRMELLINIQKAGCILDDNEKEEFNLCLSKIKSLNKILDDTWDIARETHMYTYQSIQYCRALEILQKYRKQFI